MTSRAKLRRIDAVQLGTTGRDEEREVMRELVTDPRAGELWFEALRRRRRIDRVAALVRAAPWLARPMLATRTIGRGAIRATSGASWSITGRAELYSVLDVQRAKRQRVVEVAWGRCEIVAVDVGDRVVVNAAPRSDHDITLWYQTASARGPMPTRTWEFVEAEAPVILTLVAGRASADTLDDASRGATGAASVILVARTQPIS